MTDIRIPEANSREVARAYRERVPDLPVLSVMLCRVDAACASKDYHLEVLQDVLGDWCLGNMGGLREQGCQTRGRNLYGGDRTGSATERRRLRNHGRAKERASPAGADRDCVHGDPLSRPRAGAPHL